VDEFSDLFAFKPEGNYILTFRNEDRPGAISEVLYARYFFTTMEDYIYEADVILAISPLFFFMFTSV
jgi:hypothetical protein